MQIGPQGTYLGFRFSQFLQGNKRCVQRESYIQPKLAADLIKNSTVQSSSKSENELTQREYEVIVLIAEGLNTRT